jgi:curli biogenesis system outer membrane secretion channel CsgG
MKLILILFITLFFTSCSKQLNLAKATISESLGSSIDISKYKTNINEKIDLPQECRVLYENKKHSVAVVNFTNNTNFSSADVNDKSSDDSVHIGLNIIGIGAGKKSSSSKTKRLVNPKLASSFIPMIQDMLIKTGSVNLFEREDYEKVNTELKFQDSGLLDPNSVVEFGKTSGVKYIVTGSIDKVSHNYRNYSQFTNKAVNAAVLTKDKDFKIAAASLHLASSFFDGTTVKTAVTVKIIDVASGRIVFTKKINNESKINGNKEPTYSQLVGAVKDNIEEALPALENRLLKHFSYNAYITKIKEYKDDRIVQINLGKDSSIKKDMAFEVFNIESTTDPLSGKITCDLIPTKLELEVKEVLSNSSWTTISEGNEKDTRLLQIVKRK